MPRKAAPDSPNRQLTVDEAADLTGRSRQTILNYLTIGLPDRPEHGRLAGLQLPSVQVPGRSRTGYQYRIKLGSLIRAGLLDPEEPIEEPIREPEPVAEPARRAVRTSAGGYDRALAKAQEQLEQQAGLIADLEAAIGDIDADLADVRRAWEEDVADLRERLEALESAPVPTDRKSTWRRR